MELILTVLIALSAFYYHKFIRANAIILPYVIDYNSQKPTKFAAFPKYKKFIADEKYAKIASYLGLSAETNRQGVESLITAIRKLMKEVNIPTSISKCGISKEDFNSRLETLATNAFEDQCTTTNPRYPLIRELEEILRKAY